MKDTVLGVEAHTGVEQKEEREWHSLHQGEYVQGHGIIKWHAAFRIEAEGGVWGEIGAEGWKFSWK